MALLPRIPHFYDNVIAEAYLEYALKGREPQIILQSAVGLERVRTSLYTNVAKANGGLPSKLLQELHTGAISRASVGAGGDSTFINKKWGSETSFDTASPST